MTAQIGRVTRLARARSTRVALAVLVAAVALAACLPASPPLENGRLPDSMLTTVTPSCRIVNEVAPRLQALIADANKMGYAVQPESQSFTAPLPAPPTIESCYRSYDGQVWWRNFYCFFANCAMAAVPGTSVHGWGRAVDFECAGREMTFDAPCYAWLKFFAGNYGFVHPAWAEPGQPGAEPWHWEAT
jgi:hypothetical protein